jgi:hypothetical protein
MRTLVITAFLLRILQDLRAQNIQKVKNNAQDSTAISTVLEDYYFKGIYEGNLNLLNQVYYTGTLLFGDVKGQPYAKTLAMYLDGVKNRVSPKDSGKPFNVRFQLS